MTNLITRLGWETRVAVHEEQKSGKNGSLTAKIVSTDAREFVDYLLFVDEAPLAAKLESTSGFAAKFAAPGPRDGKGRSLRDLALDGRLMRYPCSYMIYSPAFDALPVEAKDAVYKRMWEVLSGKETEPKYRKLSSSDRAAVLEILRDTKKDLPAYFR
jgi:hypothetical protein